MTDRCRTCGEPEHVTFPDCDSCKGSGHRIGGDEQRPCARCRLRGRDTGRAPFVARAMAGTLAPKVLA